MQGWTTDIPKFGQQQKKVEQTTTTVQFDEQRYVEEIKQRDKGSRQIIIREKKGIYEYNCYEQAHRDVKLMDNPKDFIQSQDGQYLICGSDTQLSVIDHRQNKILNTIKNFTQIRHISISDNNEYIQIMDDKGVDNYVTTLYTFPDFQIKGQFTDKIYVPDNWPVIKMTSDYKLMLKYNFETLKVESFDLSSFLKVRQFDVGIIDLFYLSPNSNWEDFSIISFRLEKQQGFKKVNGQIQIFKFSLDKPFLTEELVDTNFVKLVWANNKKKALIKQESYSDSSNQSYYGKTKLKLLDLEQKDPKRIFQEIPTSEGPLHDFCWQPDGDSFLVLSGFMPATIILYNKDCKPEFDFGSAYRNTLRWSSTGRFCLIAGFGNLKGEIDIWDMKELKKIGNCVSSASSCCIWSPDGRKFMTATTTPQLRVDNMMRIYYYDGSLLQKIPYTNTELYQVNWINSKEKHLNRPVSPEVLKKKQLNPTEQKPEEKKFFRPAGFSESAIINNFKQDNTYNQAKYITNQNFIQNSNQPQNQKPQQVLKPGQAPIEQKPKKKRVRKRDLEKNQPQSNNQNDNDDEPEQDQD